MRGSTPPRGRSRKDIVVTWPKHKPLAKYLEALEQALRDSEFINFRVPSLPPSHAERCYRVHDGAIRGFTTIIRCEHRGPRVVARTEGGGYWPEGNYVVCSPVWVPLTQPFPMQGFRGWRWLDWERE